LFTTTLRRKVFLLCALSLCRTPATTTTTAAMDLFAFYPPSSVLICKPCGYAVPPTTLATHIKVHHLHDARHAATNLFDAPQSRNLATLLANYLCERYQLLDPAIVKLPTPPACGPSLSGPALPVACTEAPSHALLFAHTESPSLTQSPHRSRGVLIARTESSA
jgi:hypothetical protein